MLELALVVTVLIMVVGFSSNIITLVALLKCPQVRNIETAFIVSLCVVDCLICVFPLPFKALAFYYENWEFGDTLCQLVPSFRRTSMAFIFFLITTITINRYIMIIHYSVYNRIYTPFRVAVMITLCWILAFSIQAPTLLGYWGKYGFDEKIKSCTLVDNEQVQTCQVAVFIASLLIPSTIVIYCYTRIYWVVHSSESRMRKHAALSTQDSRAEKGKADLKDRRKEWKAAKMILAIFFTFFVSYIPAIVLRAVDRDKEWIELHIWSTIILYMSTCINPIIYGVMNKQYREAYRILLTSWKPNTLSVTRPGTSYRVNDQRQGQDVVEANSKSTLQSNSGISV